MTTQIYTINDIKRLLSEILKQTEVEKAILFGSYAKNTPTKTSDIDILIDSQGKIKGLKFYALIDLIKETFDKDVDVIEKAEVDVGSRIEQEIENKWILKKSLKIEK